MQHGDRLMRSVIFVMCFLPSTTHAIPITLHGEFQDTRSPLTTFGGTQAEMILNSSGLANRKNSPSAVVDIDTNRENGPVELAGEPVGATQLITGTPHSTSTTGNPTSIIYRPTSFESTNCSMCIIGFIDIFNGINNAGSSGNSFILELTLPTSVPKDPITLGVNPDIFPAKWWFFIENTLNSPGDVPDAFAFARGNTPTNPTEFFFVSEDQGRVGLGLRADLTGNPAKPIEIVPEPNTFLLIGTGLFGLLIWRRKNSRNMS